jgi:hypothetical protein
VARAGNFMTSAMGHQIGDKPEDRFRESGTHQAATDS